MDTTRPTAKMAVSAPPPESSRSIRDRTWIICSFWAVIVFLGFPTWWQTTSIPRAALPHQDMLTWSETPETRPVYTVPIRIAAPDIPCQSALKLVTEIESLLNKNTLSWGFKTSIELVYFTNTNGNVKRTTELNCAAQEVTPDSSTTTFDIELRPDTSFHADFSSSKLPVIVTYLASSMDGLASDLAGVLEHALADERASVAFQYNNRGRSDPRLSEYIDNLSAEVKGSIHNNAARAFKSSPEFHLTFSLFTPGGYPSSWEIQEALNRYIEPVLHAVSSTANISVTTQLQLYSSFSPSIQPRREEDTNGWILRQADLTAFVNTAEWPLSPSVGLGQTINFVLYIPSKQQSPLRIEGHHNSGVLGGSWIIPQWGGITILNAPIVRNVPDVNREDVIEHLDAGLLEPAFSVFRNQLLLLLGVPQSTTLSLPLRLKTFQRLSALSLHLRTSSNLGSLARLADHLSSIPIPRHVSDLVYFAMDSLKAYRKDKNTIGAITAASEGYKASEKAFFDKSMIGQVYFPDEHKVAVYLPLLGPIGVPLVVGLLREIKAFATRFKS